MAHTDWMIRGPEIASCNCSYGCPCQFNALPTDGTCRAAVGIQIDKGHYGKVKLDGLRLAATAAWPGPIHMGHGEIQPIVDERATPEQREALLKIMSGQDTEPLLLKRSVAVLPARSRLTSMGSAVAKSTALAASLSSICAKRSGAPESGIASAGSVSANLRAGYAAA